MSQPPARFLILLVRTLTADAVLDGLPDDLQGQALDLGELWIRFALRSLLARLRPAKKPPALPPPEGH